ncbi:hypothetical protein Csa_009990 [Cucumis sativus]|uniref:Uncharacterized protein n=1 Tax=Cucumis sativus TaxID=3659 RepID=A0A0A0LB74_CUCSA|nr:hypothetical protein Csa_009990 [Cucumis sativus]
MPRTVNFRRHTSSKVCRSPNTSFHNIEKTSLDDPKFLVVGEHEVLENKLDTLMSKHNVPSFAISALSSKVQMQSTMIRRVSRR